MPIRYCTRCWTQNMWESVVCARCGAPLAGPEANTIPYSEKLLMALRHPEPETRARAASILGQIGDASDPRLTQALTEALRAPSSAGESSDAGLQVAAAQALGQLGMCAASGALCRLALNEATHIAASLQSVEALALLAQQGCSDAYQCIEQAALTAGRGLIRNEASTALARLNEPE